MNRDVERAAAKLERLCRESNYCSLPDDSDEAEPCATPALTEAAGELLDELRRSGVIPVL